MIHVAVMGYGTVGSGVVEVLETNKALISRRANDTVEVKYILDLRDFPGDPYADKVIHEFDTLVNDKDVSIVCEAMGGVGVAYRYTKACLEAGKSVCTSNKELVAKHGPELLEIAKKNHCSYLFEASVGGGIPIIRTMQDALTAEEIVSVMGILNGTTNYMLSKMQKEGAEYEDVLKQAQAMGYAEADPTADVEGHDACRKIAILSSLMTGKNVDSEKIYTEGISHITAADFDYAKAADKCIKLLAMSHAAKNGELFVMVAPAMLSKEHPLAMVNGVFNAVFVTGNMLGDSMYYGKGAGKLPTASAVVGDVVDCARNLGETKTCLWEAENVKLTDTADAEWGFYLRAKKGALDKVKEALPGGELVMLADRQDEFAYFTTVMKEADFNKIKEKLQDDVLGSIRLA